MVRLSRIVTKTGDGGETALGDGSRVAKDHPRIAATGTVDELNAVLGLIPIEDHPEAVLIRSIQNDLFDLGADLCVPQTDDEKPRERLRIGIEHVTRLEQVIDRLNAPLAPLTSFVLPGGTPAAARCHLARTVCRRAERDVVTLMRTEPMNPQVLVYLNRLSDLLFVLSRVVNDGGDVLWKPGGKEQLLNHNSVAHLMTSFNDRLTAAVRAKGTALCVGLDPRRESLPRQILDHHDSDVAGAIEEFCLRVLDIVAPIVPVVKPQSAFFEALGPPGFLALQHVLCRAKDLGIVTTLDAKRGDIASTASAYAEAAFDVFDADAVTVNPYLGRDAIEPFLNRARKDGRGLFVLVRTSNPGAGLFQNLNCDGTPLYQHVAAAVREWNAGLGDVGAVIGATQPAELKLLRQLLPHEWFLIPGYGTQGGTAADVRGGFRSDGLGAIVNSSRGVTFPFTPDEPNWEAAIERAARTAAAELKVGVPASAG